MHPSRKQSDPLKVEPYIVIYILLFALSSVFILNWESWHGQPSCVICVSTIEQATSYPFVLRLNHSGLLVPLHICRIQLLCWLSSTEACSLMCLHLFLTIERLIFQEYPYPTILLKMADRAFCALHQPLNTVLCLLFAHLSASYKWDVWPLGPSFFALSLLHP